LYWCATTIGKKVGGHENTDRLDRNLAIYSKVSYDNFMDRTSREYNNIEGYQKQGRYEVFSIGSDDTITVTHIVHIVNEQLSLERERDNVRNYLRILCPEEDVGKVTFLISGWIAPS
jgi:hypothetical protein